RGQDEHGMRVPEQQCRPHPPPLPAELSNRVGRDGHRIQRDRWIQHPASEALAQAGGLDRIAPDGADGLTRLPSRLPLVATTARISELTHLFGEEHFDGFSRRAASLRLLEFGDIEARRQQATTEGAYLALGENRDA